VSGIHLASMVVAAVGLLGALAAGAWAAIRRIDPQPWLDRSLLLSSAGSALAIVSGGLLVAIGSQPADPLHLVYAVAIVAVPLGARYLVRPGRSRRDAAALALGALVGLAVIIRLVQTG
jgi:drug/metabolite transporter (DMT)-like permease